MFTIAKEAVAPQDLLLRAQGYPPIRTGIVNAINPVVLESVRDAVNARLIEPVLVGERQRVHDEAQAMGLDVSQFEVVDAVGEEESARRTATLAAPRL